MTIALATRVRTKIQKKGRQRRKETYALGERRAKTRRSPSLMSRRTLQFSHVILEFDSAMVASAPLILALKEKRDQVAARVYSKMIFWIF